jgi:phage I-like protein
MKTKAFLNFALAACVTDLSGKVPTEIQLTPAGTFKAKDGRPAGLSGWVLDNENAKTVVQLANSQSDAFVIDYEHQTLYSKQNGMPAPAAGWFKGLQYREGLGLFATQVEWTDSAALAIQNKEYRYISPVIAYDPKTGVVTKILMAAITNNPALDGLSDLTALATDYFTQQTEALSMDLDELLERLRYLFNLPTLATAEEIKAQMDKLRTLMDSAQTETAAASSILDLLKAKDSEIAALSGQYADSAQFVPAKAFQDLQKNFAALSEKINQNAVDDLVKVGLSDGRITPALSDWAKGLSHAALSDFLDKATPIAGLSNTQTGGKAPEGEQKPELTPEEIAVCSAMGLTHDQFIETKAKGEK